VADRNGRSLTASVPGREGGDRGEFERAGVTWSLWHYYLEQSQVLGADDVLKAVAAGPAARAR